MKALFLDALRTHRVRPASALVAHLGLALALAASLLVGLLAIALSEPDPGIPDPQRIVVLDFKGNPPGQPADWFTASPVFFGPALKAAGAPLDYVARAQEGHWTLRQAGGSLKVFGVLMADADIAPLMGLHALHGDLQRSLREPDAVAITADAARLLWGELPLPEALGRLVTSDGKHYRIAAVIPAFGPQHPLFGQDFVTGFDSQANGASLDDRNALYVVNGRVFGRLRPGVQAAQIAGWMRAAFVAHPSFASLPKDWVSAGREAAYFRALPLPRLRMEGGNNAARWLQIAALGIACALLVLMAAINALNLQAAQLLQRQRETALRQALGASAGQLLRLWATELGLALLAVGGLAWLAAWWLAPALLNWLEITPGTPLFGPAAWQAGAALVVVLAILLVALLGLPAALALRRAPAAALQGRTASEGPWGRRLRQGLLTLQLSGALLLLALTGLVGLQHRHLLQADRGFHLENRLLLDIWAGPADAPALVPLVEELTRHPAVAHWAFSSMVPPWGAQGTVENYRQPGNGEGATLKVAAVSNGFFDTYGIRVLAGDPRAPLHGDTGVVLDAQAARLLGFATAQAAVGELVLGGGEFLQAGQQAQRVLAVIADVKLETGRETAQPRVFRITENYQVFLTLYGPDPVALRTTVEQLWQKHRLPFFYMLDAVSVQSRVAYQQEAQLAGSLGAVALLAVAVAAAGAYALVADTLRRRRTELVLRRLHGAGDKDIGMHVLGEFSVPLSVAALVALPLACWLDMVYRNGFVDRLDAATGLGVPLVLAVLVTGCVTALAAWRHVRLALALRPIEALV